MEGVEELQQNVSTTTSVFLHQLADSVGISYRSIRRCTSIGSRMLGKRLQNPSLNSLTKILSYLLQTGDLTLRLPAICRFIVKAKRENKMIVMSLRNHDLPLQDGEEIMLFHIPEDLSESRKHQCLRNMAKRKNAREISPIQAQYDKKYANLLKDGKMQKNILFKSG